MGEEIKERFTDFLYSRPSFLEGVARVVDFANVLQEYNASSTPEIADERATRADWKAVGSDMYKALEKVGINRK